MPISKNSPTQKQRSQKRTKKINDLISKYEKGLLSPFEVPGTKGRVLTLLDPNNDCFHSKGKYLYIGAPSSQFKKNAGKSTPKLGKAELPIGETIGSSRDRYNIKDPFVVIDVITIDDSTLDKFGVKTVRQLEEKIRKVHGFEYQRMVTLNK